MNNLQFFQRNGSILIIGGVSFLVLSSKNIIIYNEEILIGLSFLAFLAFTTVTMGKNIREVFILRKEIIQRELQKYLDTKELLLQDLVQEYKKSLALEGSLIYLRDQSCVELKNLYFQREKGLRASFAAQLRSRLHFLEQTENRGQGKIQQSWKAGFRYGVFETFQQTKKVVGPKLIQQALAQLNQSGRG